MRAILMHNHFVVRMLTVNNFAFIGPSSTICIRCICHKCMYTYMKIFKYLPIHQKHENVLSCYCCGASEPEASERSSSLISVVGSQKVNF